MLYVDLNTIDFSPKYSYISRSLGEQKIMKKYHYPRCKLGEQVM